MGNPLDAAPGIPRDQGAVVYVADLQTTDDAGRPRYGVLRGEVMASNRHETLILLDDGRAISVPTLDLHTRREQADGVVRRTLNDRRTAFEAERLITGRAPRELGGERAAEERYLAHEVHGSALDPRDELGRRARRDREYEEAAEIEMEIASRR